MAEAAVELDGVVARYHGRAALGPLSWRVGRGEFWGVVGPNGAGKSTLLATIAGARPAVEGRVTVLGERVFPPDGCPRRMLRQAVGFFFQHHDFLPDLPFTVEEVVLFGRVGRPGVGRRYQAADRQAAEKALARLGLLELRGRLYRELSGGEKQKTQLARLVAQEAELLLLDEPAAGLDLDWRERLTRLVEELYLTSGKTIIMVTHEVDRLPACCGRALLLKGGRELACGTPAEVFKPEVLARLYDCRMEVRLHEGRFYALSLGARETP